METLTLSFSLCKQTCIQRPLCKSIDHFLQTNKCDLFTITPEDQEMVEESNSVHRDLECQGKFVCVIFFKLLHIKHYT